MLLSCVVTIRYILEVDSGIGLMIFLRLCLCLFLVSCSLPGPSDFVNKYGVTLRHTIEQFESSVPPVDREITLRGLAFGELKERIYLEPNIRYQHATYYSTCMVSLIENSARNPRLILSDAMGWCYGKLIE